MIVLDDSALTDIAVRVHYGDRTDVIGPMGSRKDAEQLVRTITTNAPHIRCEIVTGSVASDSLVETL